MTISFDNLSFDNFFFDREAMAELAPKLGLGLGALGALFVTYASRLHQNESQWLIDEQCALWIAYTLTLHPLAKYPGPFVAKITGFYSVYHAYVGDLHLDMLKCHEAYGTTIPPLPFVATLPGTLQRN